MRASCVDITIILWHKHTCNDRRKEQTQQPNIHRRIERCSVVQVSLIY